MRASLAFVHVTARHFNAWGLQTTWPETSISLCSRLLFSWISKKHLTPHGTLACYIKYPNCTFRPA